MSSSNAPTSSAKKIAPLIMENIESLKPDIKKPIVLIGLSQSGKTTLLNSLMGASYKIEKGEKLIITNSSFTDGGKIGGEDGGSCTLLPYIKSINDLGIAVADGPGQGETRNSFKINDNLILNSSEIKVMQSILMEMLTKQAESVSVVLVLNYQKFANGIKDMQENGEMIHRLFKNVDSQQSIFILFNRFFSIDKNEMDLYYSLKGKEKYDFVCSKVIKKAEQMNKSKDAQSNMEYFNILYNNIKKNNIGYLHVEDNEIIDILRAKFQSLPPFPKEKIYFDNSSEIRVEFNNLCRTNLFNYNNQICKSQIKLQYPLNLLNSIIECCDKSLFALNDFIKKISKEKHSDEKNILSVIKEEETRNKIQSDELTKQIKENENNKSTHEEKIKNCQNKISKYENDKRYLTNSIGDINTNINQLKQNLQSKTSSLESNSRRLGNLIDSNNNHIRELTNSLGRFEEIDPYPIEHQHIYEEGIGSDIHTYFSSSTYHDPNYTRIELNKPRINYQIINDSPNNCYIKFTKGGSLFHPHPEIDADVYLYAKKKDTQSSEYSSIKSNIDRYNDEIRNANSQISQINNETYEYQQKITNSINQKKAEKKDKESQLNNVIISLNLENNMLQQEKSYLADANSKITMKKNDLSSRIQNADKLKRDIENVSYALTKIDYFQNIKVDISEKYKIINDFPDFTSEYPEEISAIMLISEKLRININELAQIRREKQKERMLNQNHSIFTLNLTNNSNKNLFINCPDQINFIDPATKKQISYEGFHKMLIDDINSRKH